MSLLREVLVGDEQRMVTVRALGECERSTQQAQAAAGALEVLRVALGDMEIDHQLGRSDVDKMLRHHLDVIDTAIHHWDQRRKVLVYNSKVEMRLHDDETDPEFMRVLKELFPAQGASDQDDQHERHDRSH